LSFDRSQELFTFDQFFILAVTYHDCRRALRRSGDVVKSCPGRLKVEIKMLHRE
jgi:hypothetical protein